MILCPLFRKLSLLLKMYYFSLSQRQGKPKPTQRRTGEKKREIAGWKSWREVQWQWPTDLVDGNVQRPSVTLGMKRVGKGEI